MGLYCRIDFQICTPNSHVLTVIDEADRRIYERQGHGGATATARFTHDRTLKAIKESLMRPIPLRPGSLRGDFAQDPNRDDATR